MNVFKVVRVSEKTGEYTSCIVHYKPWLRCVYRIGVETVPHIPEARLFVYGSLNYVLGDLPSTGFFRLLLCDADIDQSIRIDSIVDPYANISPSDYSDFWKGPSSWAINHRWLYRFGVPEGTLFARSLTPIMDLGDRDSVLRLMEDRHDLNPEHSPK